MTLLEAPRPNPSTGDISLTYDLARSGPIRLAVHDLRGRVIRVIADSYANPGHYFAYWDGRDAARRPVAPGVYFVTLDAGADARSKRVILIH